MITTLELIEKIGKLVVPADTSIKVLKNISVKHGAAYMTDLDIFIKIKNSGLRDGMYDFSKFYHTRVLIDAIESPEDFPIFPDFEDTHEIKNLDFSKHFNPYLNYTGDETFKMGLSSVCINSKGTCATNGCFGMLNLERTCEVEINMSKKIIKLLKLINKYDEMNIGYEYFDKSRDTRYLCFKNDNFDIIYRLPSEEYPDFLKIIPDKIKQTEIKITYENVIMLRKVLKTLLPFTDVETNMVKIEKNEVKVENRGADKFIKITLPFDLAPHEISYINRDSTFGVLPFKIGFNAKYLLRIFDDIQTDISISYGNRHLSRDMQSVYGTIFTCTDGNLFLLMPLKILDEVESKNINYQILSIEQTPPATKPSKNVISKNLQKIINNAVKKHGEKLIIDLLEVL